MDMQAMEIAGSLKRVRIDGDYVLRVEPEPPMIMLSYNDKAKTPNETMLPMQQCKNHFLKMFEDEAKGDNPFAVPKAEKYDEHLLKRTLIQVISKEKAAKEKHRFNQGGCTTILIGETGCGKSTQVPQILFDYWKERFGVNVQMVITEPRRIAAITLSERVGKELATNTKTKVNGTVAHKVRFSSTVNDKTSIVYITEGILLQEIISDPYLLKYNVVVVDEAHETSVSTELILGYLKRLVYYRNKAGHIARREILKLRLIIMSATAEANKFRNFFHGAKCLMVQGRLHPVDINYVVDDLENDYLTATMATVLKLHDSLEPDKHFLVFLTGQEEIEGAVRQLRQLKHATPISAYPLYAALSQAAQTDAFTIPKEGTRKIVVATNIAETSLTIPGIKIVIDSGFVKSKFYIPSHGLEAYQVRRISRAQANQRAGRAGRIDAGSCYRIYTKTAHRWMELYEEPEITRSNLSQFYLMRPFFNSLGGSLDLMHPISEEMKTHALLELDALGLFREEKLTEMGAALVRFPLQPNLAVVVWYSASFGVLNQVCAIVGLIETENIFSRWSEEDHKKILQKFVAPEGDLITYWNIFREFSKSKQPKQFCELNKLNYRALQNAKNVKEQLRELVMSRLKDLAMDYNQRPHDQAIEAVVKCFGVNIPWNRATLDPSGKFYNIERNTKRKRSDHAEVPLPTTAKPLRAKIHPSSVLLAAKPPRVFFMKLTLNDNSDMFLHHCTVFDTSMEKQPDNCIVFECTILPK